MNHTEELQIDQNARGIFPGLRGRIDRRLDAIAAVLEAKTWIIFAIIALLYLAYVATHAVAHPLWHDELFTYYIAQAPDLRKLLEQARVVDLNPPLYYLLARFVFWFAHPGTLSVRLPSIGGFFLASCLLYSFVRRRLGPIYGLLSALVLLGGFYRNYAYEARPYALILAFLGVAAVGWQRSIQAGEDHRPRWPGMSLLVLGGFGMLLSHVLALLAYGAFFFAELVRFLIRRKADWPLWICLLLPLATTALYVPLLRAHGAGVFPIAFQASPLRLIDNYAAIGRSLIPLSAAAVIAVVLLRARETAPSSSMSKTAFSVPEWSFAVYLLFVPLLVTVAFMRSHSAYFDRYGIPAVFGASIVVPALIARWTRSSRLAGLVAALVFVFGIAPPASFVTVGRRLVHRPSEGNSGNGPAPFTAIEKNLPFVDASGLTFIEMDNRENSGFLSRVYYLTDRQAALQYAHATIFEDEAALKRIFPIRANVMPYRQFVHQHPRFLVYGTFNYPEDWLLRKLLADGATIRCLGNFSSGYKDSALYEITYPQR